MENIFVEFLPPWVETGIQPAFYDKESGTVLQQTARMYARVNMLIRMFNKLSKETKETVEDYINRFNELHDYVHDYFENLDVQEEIDNKLDEMVEDGTFEELLENYLHKLNDYSDSNQITVGNNLITNNELWVLNDGWTTDGNGTFTHIVNETADLVYNYNFDANKLYIIDFQINTSLPAGENASCAITPVIGNTTPIVIYRGGGSAHYTIALKPTEAGTLKFKCVSQSDPFTTSGVFNGSISAITLKEASGTLEQLYIKDADDNKSLAFSITPSANKSVAIGYDAGITNYNQTGNVYIGDEAGKDDATGYFNIGIGGKTLSHVVNASRNIAIGYASSFQNQTGDRNIAIGTFALTSNTAGRKNIALGFDTMMGLQSGSENLAIGNQALSQTTNATGQIAIGTLAMAGSTYSGTAPNIAIGRASVYRPTTGTNNIGIGNNTLYKDTTGGRNVAIGTNALTGLETISGMIGIGVDAGNKVTAGSSSVIIGDQMSQTTLTSMTRSVGIGTGLFSAMTALTNTILMGYHIQADGGHTALQNVLALNPGKKTMTIAKDNFVNIANVIYADLTTDTKEKVGIGVDTPTARLHLAGGSSTANTAPLKFTSGTLLSSAEDGALEYDGTHLYFTIGSTRNTII